MVGPLEGLTGSRYFLPEMTLWRAGGIPAAVCAATCLVGVAPQVTVLAPSGRGTAGIDLAAVMVVGPEPGHDVLRDNPDETLAAIVAFSGRRLAGSHP